VQRGEKVKEELKLQKEKRSFCVVKRSWSAWRDTAIVKRRRSAWEGPINAYQRKKCTSVPRLCDFWLWPTRNLNIRPRALVRRVGHARVRMLKQLESVEVTLGGGVNGLHVVNESVRPLCLYGGAGRT